MTKYYCMSSLYPSRYIPKQKCVMDTAMTQWFISSCDSSLGLLWRFSGFSYFDILLVANTNTKLYSGKYQNKEHPHTRKRRLRLWQLWLTCSAHPSNKPTVAGSTSLHSSRLSNETLNKDFVVQLLQWQWSPIDTSVVRDVIARRTKMHRRISKLETATYDKSCGLLQDWRGRC